MQRRLCLYYLKPEPSNRWFKGDYKIRKIIRYLIRGTERPSSLEMVFLHLCEGLKRLNVDFTVNLPFERLSPTDVVIILGQGKYCLKNYTKPNPIIAGIGLMTHPNDWPTIFKEYSIKAYLQHSKWTSNIYNRWFGENTCKIWQAGINTDFWSPIKNSKKHILIYEKFLWDKEQNQNSLTKPIIRLLQSKNIKYQIIRYGEYKSNNYKKLLEDSSAMIFLCEHESQGLAYQEAMAMNVPIFAWEQGLWLDPNRFTWGEQKPIPATSVPFFDERCGMKFKNLQEFQDNFETFYTQVQECKFSPRSYVLEYLTLEKSALRMLEIVKEVY